MTLIKHKYTRRELILIGAGGLALQSGISARASAAEQALATPSQTPGPFFPSEDQPDKDADLTQIAGRAQQAHGNVILVSGRVFSTEHKPLQGVSIDVWQANAWGRYAHAADRNTAPVDHNFQGWAQLLTDANGFYRFKTIMPGPYPVSDTWSRPPHIHFKLSKHGYSSLTTQMYFAGHPLNDVDDLLLQHTSAQRQQLVVDFEDTGVVGQQGSIKSGEFNIYLDRLR